MSLVHGGGAFRLFGPTVFNFLCGSNPADLITGVSEVPDPSIREFLKQVSLEGPTCITLCEFGRYLKSVSMTDDVSCVCVHVIIGSDYYRHL